MDIAAPRSMYPPKKYCDLTGFEVRKLASRTASSGQVRQASRDSPAGPKSVVLQAPYMDPKTKLQYANASLFPVVRSLPRDVVHSCLAVRKAYIELR